MTLDEKPAKENKARAFWLCNFVYPLGETIFAKDGTAKIGFGSQIHFFIDFRDVINYLEDLSRLIKYE